MTSNSAFSEAEKSAIISEIEESLNSNVAQKTKAMSQVKVIIHKK